MRSSAVPPPATHELDRLRRRVAELEAAAAGLSQSEAARQLSDERLASVLENAPDVIYRRDIVADRYDCVSPSVEALTGYTPEEFTGGGLQVTIGRIHPDDLEGSHRAIRDVMTRSSGHGHADYRYRRKDGTYRWFSDDFMITRDTQGTPRYWVGSVRDVTDLKEAEAALRRSHDELESEVQRRTGQLRAMTARLIDAEEQERARIGHVLHEDLQQILVGLRFTLRAMEKDATGENQTASALAVVDEALRVTRSLSTDLLPPSGIEDNLVEGLAWLVADMHRRMGLEVALEADAAAVPVSTQARVFIFRAVSELLLNVAKHAGTRQAQVRLQTAGNDRTQVVVQDDGTGMDLARTRTGGVGLFRIGERAETLGGSLRISPAPGSGTCVTLDLPRH